MSKVISEETEVEAVVAEGEAPASRDAIEEPLDVGDKTSLKKRKRDLRFQNEKEIADLKHVLSTYRGRAFVWRQLGKCEIFSAGFADNDRFLNFKEGKRTVGVELQIECLTHAPDLYILMQNEAIERDTKEKDK